MRARAAWPGRLLLGLAVAALLLAATEAGLRRSGRFPAQPLPSPFGPQWEPNPPSDNEGDAAWRPCPGTVQRWCSAEVTGWRVVVVGGSAAAGLPYPPVASFTARLERMLAPLVPDGPVEVLNLGVPGYASRQVRWLVQYHLDWLDPDLLVVYSGNNEFWELRGQRVLDPDFDVRLLRAQHLLSGLALFRGLERSLGARAPTRPTLQPLNSASMASQVTEADRRFATWQYRRNLEAIADRARQLDVPVLVATVADDLTHPPSHAEPAGPQDQALLTAVQQRDAAAISALAQPGVGVSGRGAYDAGLDLLRLGEVDQASALLQLAEYLDVEPVRANRMLRMAALELAEEEGVASCDVAAELATRSAQGVPGRDEFFDWCHPNDRGHQLVAEVLAGCIVDQGLLPVDASGLAPAIASLAALPADPYRVDRLPALGRPANERCRGTLPGLAETCRGHDAFSQGNTHAAAQALSAYRAALDAGAPERAGLVNIGLAAFYAGDLPRARQALDQVLALGEPEPGLENLRALLGDAPAPSP